MKKDETTIDEVLTQPNKRNALIMFKVSFLLHQMEKDVPKKVKKTGRSKLLRYLIAKELRGELKWKNYLEYQIKLLYFT